jgi:hypothetical protein
MLKNDVRYRFVTPGAVARRRRHNRMIHLTLGSIVLHPLRREAYRREDVLI